MFDKVTYRANREAGRRGQYTPPRDRKLTKKEMEEREAERLKHRKDPSHIVQVGSRTIRTNRAQARRIERAEEHKSKMLDQQMKITNRTAPDDKAVLRRVAKKEAGEKERIGKKKAELAKAAA